MVDAAVDTLGEVDVVVLVFDASSKPGRGDEYVSKLLQRVSGRAVLALNKIDLVHKTALLPLIERAKSWHDFAAIVPVSATTGDGVDVLERVVLEQLPEGDPIYPPDFLTDQHERALAAEIVREKVLLHTHDELPFSTAVSVDQFDESARDERLAIYATILVERESQKPIVIGRAGEMIKRIGSEARQDLERFFETKVFLDLHVKVNPDWRDDERTLDALGLPKTRNRKRR
jgi:GTP-binding protein Era